MNQDESRWRREDWRMEMDRTALATVILHHQRIIRKEQEEKQILEVDSRAHSAQMLVACVYLCILVSQRIQNN